MTIRRPAVIICCDGVWLIVSTIYSFLIAAFLLYFPFIWCYLRKETPESYGLTWKFTKRTMRECIMTTLCVLIPLTVIAMNWPAESLPRSSSLARTINLAGGGLAAAFIEEVFFRGWMQTLLRRRFSPLLAIGITSAVFAASHLFMNPAIHSMAVFFPGIIMGILRERDGNIAGSTAFHAIANIWAIWFSPSIWFVSLP